MAALEIVGLRKSYGSIRALRDVSFLVNAGEIFGLLGPNGAGKTTTLRIVMGLVHADAGTVRLLGQPSAPSVREHVGYLPGELKLYTGMTAGAILDLFARFRPARPPVLRAHLLDALALAKSDLTRRVKFLSHGTRQKVGLVVAMQHDPEILLLDEPTSGLDPLVQRDFRQLLKERAAEGRTVLLSSHVLAEVDAVCHRVAVLRSGELFAIESMETLRSRMVRRMHLRVRGSLPAGVESIPGVARAETSDKEAVLWVQGDVNPLLRAIARTDVERFVFAEPQLEDVFFDLFTGGPP